MDYIVLDLEWNQSPNGKGTENKAVPFEIVEIGAIKLNADFEIVSEFSEIIAPRIYRQMHRITQELIHLDMEQLSHGGAFPDVIRRFFDWCGSDYRFCTWGMMDLTELQRNMKYYDIDGHLGYPLMYYDVQKLFSIAYEDRKSRRSLEYAIDYLKFDKDEAFHRAKSDAYYTALILEGLPRAVLKNYSLDYYRTPKNRKEEVYVVFDTYSKYISREFATKERAMKDREVLSTRCYLCGNPAKKKLRWFSGGSRLYYSVSCCEEHGYLKGKIRLKKAENGKVFAVKTLKLVSSEEAEGIRERKEHIKEKRKKKALQE